MNVCLFTSVYFNNIGNGFIDLGAEETLQAAKSADDTVVKISQCANFAASMGRAFMLKENRIVHWAWTHTMQKYASKIHDRSYTAISAQDVFSPAALFEFDCLVIPGCVLTVPFFTIYGKMLEDKVSQGCKLIFLGASGNFYSEYEVKFVTRYLKKLRPLAIMTRDRSAFQHYRSCSENVYNGIDNVFFVNRLMIPALNSDMAPYVVVNLEEPKHAKLKRELVSKLENERKNIIFSDHKPFPYAKISSLTKQGRTIISDYPLDYLALYKNADTVYSDRVHACIPVLAFGNKAVLYSDSPRKMLFENVGLKLTEKPMQVVHLEEKQEAQIEFLRSVLTQV